MKQDPQASILFSSLIVSRPRSDRSGRRQAAGIALAAALHVVVLLAYLLAPFLLLEMLEPPRAVTDVIFQPSGFRLPPGPGLGPTAGIRRGGGGPPERRSRPAPETSRPIEPPKEVVQPEQIAPTTPDPPDRRPDDSSTDPRDSVGLDPNAPEGPGDPRGKGTENEGPVVDCPGCPWGPGGGGPDDVGPYDPVLAPDYPRLKGPVLIESSRALPKYPDFARRAGVQGTVILMIVIRADGTVGEVEVIRSPDQRYGFDLAALEAVKQWRYRPALLEGRPVSVYAQVMVEFTLSR